MAGCLELGGSAQYGGGSCVPSECSAPSSPAARPSLDPSGCGRLLLGEQDNKKIKSQINTHQKVISVCHGNYLHL